MDEFDKCAMLCAAIIIAVAARKYKIIFVTFSSDHMTLEVDDPFSMAVFSRLIQGSVHFVRSVH